MATIVFSVYEFANFKQKYIPLFDSLITLSHTIYIIFTSIILWKNWIASNVQVKRRNFSSITVNMKLVPKSPLAKEKKQPPRKDFQDRWPGLPSKHTTGKNQSPFPSRTNNYTLIEIIRGGLKSKFRPVMGFFFNLLRDTANAPDTILIRAAIKPGGWNDGAASLDGYTFP